MAIAFHRPPAGIEAPGGTGRRRLRATRRRVLEALGCVAALRLLGGWLAADAPADAFAAQGPPAPAQRRQTLALLGSAVSGGAAVLGARPAGAVQGTDVKKSELIQVPARSGYRGYMFEKPAGFKRLASVNDPSGFLFRNSNDTLFSFASRAEKRVADKAFTPDLFVDDYRAKFVNSSGSSFQLIKSSNAPDRFDEKLGVKYYEVEYVVRTQLSFSFDSLKSLHYLTTFASTDDCLYIMNCQAQDDFWDKQGPTLQKIAQSFTVTS